MADKPVFTSNQIVAQLTQLGVWNAPGKPIAYAFLEQQPSYLPVQNSFQPFTAAQRAAAERAFDLIEEVADLSFVRVADNGLEPGPSNQRLTFRSLADGLQYSGSADAYQNAGSPDIYGADIILNRTGIAHRIDTQGFKDWTAYVTLHEVLHAIGLSHPGEYNGAGFSYENDADFLQDTRQYSVMSYWNASYTGADHIVGSTHHVAQTPLLYDILSLQRLYGANHATRAGDTVYGFNSNTGTSPFNFVSNPAPVIAIWDGGGRDTLDFSGWSSASLIDLNDGRFSRGGGLTGNIAIAFGAMIENARGGAGKDQLIGNEAANRLDGGRGADRMTGGDGNDTFIVDNAGDLAIEASGDRGVDLVYSLVSYTLGERIENLTLGGTAAINGTGNDRANKITGNSAANVLNGAGGNDAMTGAGGNDLYYVDSTGDRVIESSGGGFDTVISTIGHTIANHVERLFLAGGTAINGTGNSLANIIVGNEAANVIKGLGGSDTLSGGGGNDRLYGGAGKDVLTGNAGQDGFYFDTALSSSTNVDSIADFSRRYDTIFLDRDVFRGIVADGTLASGAFRVGTRALDASDRIVFDRAGGKIYYDADGAGGAGQILFATVTPDLALTWTDFVAFI